jgi:hypothetical protein
MVRSEFSRITETASFLLRRLGGKQELMNIETANIDILGFFFFEPKRRSFEY